MSQDPLSGPLEVGDFPDTLSARVITPGGQPRVHGYDIENDLARHYQASDLVLLSLTGELPTDEVRKAFDVAWQFLAPVSVAHAGPHAAVLARLCGTSTSATIGVAAIGLAEQARVLLNEHEELITWLRCKDGPFPHRFQTSRIDEHSAVCRLRTALAPSAILPEPLIQHPTRDAALLAVLFACGLRRRDQLEAAIVLARLPSALAEAFAERATNFGNYPINLPHYTYEEPE